MDIVDDQRESDDRELVESAERMHEFCTPVAVIAKRLHISQDDARFVIKRGRLPVRELLEIGL